MKRWLAMALCAVLLVGVLPVVAGAESPEEGLYSEIGQDGVPTGEMIQLEQFGPGGPMGYQIGYWSGEEYTGETYYYYLPDGSISSGYSVNTGNPSVSASFYNEHVIAIQIAPASSGGCQFDLTIGEGRIPFDIIDRNPVAGMNKTPAGNASNEDKLSIEGLTFAPVAFTVSESGTNKTYYIGPSWADENLEDSPVREDSQGLQEDETTLWMFKVGFWTASPGAHDGLEYSPVGGDDYDALLSRFSDLSITMRPTANCSRYPDRYTNETDTRLTADMSPVNAGLWVIHVQGTLNSEPINAYGKSTCIPLTTTKFAPPAINSLEDVKTYFDSVKDVAEDNQVYTFVIPAREEAYTGTLETPATPTGVDVKFTIEGGTDSSGHSVTIKGGVEANANETALVNLNFAGKGKDVENDNDCLTGKGLARYENCTFTGFYKAVVCEGESDLRWGGSECTFENNHIALYMNSTQVNGGNGDMNNMIFRNNDIALDLEHFAPGMQVYDHHITRCQFIDNQWDVCNATGRAFFLPKNYFANGSTVGIIKVCPESTGKVSAFPTATTTDFAMFDYTPKEALVSNHIENTIPTNNLTGKTITVIDQTADADKTLATWTFEGDAEEGVAEP